MLDPLLPGEDDDGNTPLQPLRHHRFVPVVVVVAIVAFVVVNVAKPWGALPGQTPPPDALIPSLRAAVPSSAASAQPSGAATGLLCTLDRVRVNMAPASAEPTVPRSMPPGTDGLVAYVVPSKAADGTSSLSVEVADPGAARQVAVVSAPGGVDESVWATVRAWSRDGRYILVAAGRFNPLVDQDNCGNLFLVRSDGSRIVPLTDNVAGATVVDGTFLADGQSVAFLESRVDPSGPEPAMLRVVRLDGTLDRQFVPCEPNVGFVPPFDVSLAPSPDARSIAVLCPDSIGIVDPVAQRITEVASQVPLSVMAIGWRSDGTHLVAIGSHGPGDLGRLSVFTIDLRTKAVTRRLTQVEEWQSGGGSAAISPDGRWLLARDCAQSSILQDCVEQLFAIDTTTGKSARIIFTGAPGVDLQVSWLPDGRHVAVSNGPGGSVIEDVESDSSVPSTLPADAVWWTPAK